MRRYAALSLSAIVFMGLAALLPVAAAAQDSPAPGLPGAVPADGTADTAATAPDTLSPLAPTADTTVSNSLTPDNPRLARALASPADGTSVVAITPLRRTTFEDDPFAPTGIAAGAYLVYPAVTLGAGYTSNGVAAAGGKGAAFLEISPELLIKSTGADNPATLSLRGSFQRFLDGSTPDEPTADIEATQRIDLRDRWWLDLDGRYDYSRQSISDPNFPAGVTNPPGVHDLSATATLNGTFGRGVVALEGLAQRTIYENAVSGGTIIDQSDRNNDLFGTRLRLGYELTPLLTPFIEGWLTRRIYDQTLDDNGIARSSTGTAIRAGLAYDSDPVLKGELALGAREEDFDDATLATIHAFTVDGSVVWSPTRLLTVTGDVTTAINPATLPGSSGSVAYAGAVDVAYAYRSDIAFDWTAGLLDESFQGIDETDMTYSLGAAVTWKLNRSLRLVTGYVHQWLTSNAPGRAYTSDAVRVDLRLQR